MKILVACEYSGIVREAFKKYGHDAWSCDLLPTDIPGQHIQGDVLKILNDGWDMMIAHPPCTHLSVSGARWFVKKAGKFRKDIKLRENALDFVRKLMDAPIPKIAIENPISVIASYIRKSDQTIQPYQFGHKERKAVCLWLKNLPKLKPTTNLYEETMALPPQQRDRIFWMGSHKGHERSRFFTGIADAMAKQWGNQ